MPPLDGSPVPTTAVVVGGGVGILAGSWMGAPRMTEALAWGSFLSAPVTGCGGRREERAPARARRLERTTVRSLHPPGRQP